PRAADGPALCLSRLLGAGLAQDGLQGALPAATAADQRRLETGRGLADRRAHAGAASDRGQGMIQDQQVNLARQDVIASPGTAVRRCRHGTMLYLQHDAYVGRSLDQYGEYSEGEVAIFRDWLRSGDIALDIGANIGIHTLPMAEIVGPIGFVHAFEPQRVIFHLLCANIALNEINHVKAHPAGVGAAAGTSKVPPLDYGGENNFAGVSIGSAYGEDVPIITIDSLELPSLRFA